MERPSAENSEIQSFQNTAGKETAVRIVHETPLSSGKFGDIVTADVDVQGHQRSFVIKKFKEEGGRSAQENAERAFRIYEQAKNHNLQVFPTYRLSEDKTSILMTDGNAHNELCLGTNLESPTVETLGYEKLEEIENFESVLESFVTGAQHATNEGVRLYPDAYFFLLDKESRKHLQWVIGDLGNLTFGNQNFENSRLIKNLDAAFQALFLFLQKNMSRNRKQYEGKITDYYNSIMTEQGLWNN